MELSDLAPKAGSKKRRRRVGRGIAAGQGASCGFGMRGQKSREPQERLWEIPPFFQKTGHGSPSKPSGGTGQGLDRGHRGKFEVDSDHRQIEPDDRRVETDRSRD